MLSGSLVKWFPVAEVGAIPKNEGRKVSFGGVEVALFHVAEGYRAVGNRCPHKQGPLADGIVAGQSVFCPLHSLKIDLQSGGAPAGSGCVKVYPVRVVGGRVFVAFQEGELRST